MSTQDKPITTPATMRAASSLRNTLLIDYRTERAGAPTTVEVATIIDQQTHLPELVEKIHAALGAMPDNSREADELRSVLEKVKGEK